MSWRPAPTYPSERPTQPQRKAATCRSPRRLGRCQTGESVRRLEIVFDESSGLKALAEETCGLEDIVACEGNVTEALKPSGKTPHTDAKCAIGWRTGEPLESGAQVVVVALDLIEQSGRLRTADEVFDGACEFEVVLGVSAGRSSSSPPSSRRSNANSAIVSSMKYR